MNASALKLLLEGAYICPIRYPDEFNLLQDVDEQALADEFLGKINKRLTRLGDEGAFFMAPAFISQKEVLQLKSELVRFRDEYGPAVLMLDHIRKLDSSRYTLTPGEYIALHELDAQVSQSTTHETELKSLRSVISGASARQSNHENLRRLMEHLVKDGYAILTERSSNTYRLTGKIEQLYAVLQFLNECKVNQDAEVDDRTVDDNDVDLFNDGVAPRSNGDD